MPNEPTDDVTRRNFIRTASTGLLAAAVAAPAAATQLAPPDKQPPDLDLPEVKKKVGWAVVGLGVLSIEQILPAFATCERSRVVALVSGHRGKAEQLADKFGVDKKRGVYTYDEYDKIAENPEIEAVFIVLPNHLHAEYTIRGLAAKKHVLCEKPMAATSEEAKRMCEAAKQHGRKLMIAYRLHYEPNHMKAIEIVRSGKIGKPKIFHAINGQTTRAPNIRLSKSTAGGPVGDTGVYCFNAARYILGEEPTEVFARSHQPKDDPNFAEVPATVSWVSTYPSGAIESSTTSFDMVDNRWLRVVGDKGHVEIDRAFGYAGQRLRVGDGGGVTEPQVKAVDHFVAEMDHFSLCVQKDKPPRTPGEEGWQDMIIQEAILKSAAEGRPVKIEGVLKGPVDPYVREPSKETALIVEK